jgi:hypothetical protein
MEPHLSIYRSVNGRVCKALYVRSILYTKKNVGRRRRRRRKEYQKVW